MTIPFPKTGISENFRQLVFDFLFLVAISIAIRLPFFFPIVINWDESTYILWGQSVLDGHLPYTEMWGFKPPLVFLFFAGAIGLFGKSIISVRIAGTACVALTAFFTYLTGKKLWSRGSGMSAAIICIALSSSICQGQSVMTEHIALVPLTGAVCLLIHRRPDPGIAFCTGILMALACMVRLNLGFVAVLVGILIGFFMLRDQPGSFGSSLKSVISYASGGLLIILLILLPYLFTGQLGLLWSSVNAALMYSGSQLTFFGAMIQQLSSGPGILILSLNIAGSAYIVVRWKSFSCQLKPGMILLIMVFSSVEISVLKGGASYLHYLIQLAPVTSLFSAMILNACFSARSREIVHASSSVLVIVLALVHSLPEYSVMLSRILAGKEISYGAAYEIAEYLKQENPRKEPVYLMTDHIVYWLIDEKPMSKSTIHPSNITREYLLAVLVGPGITTEMELGRILARKPLFIVNRNKPGFLADKPTARSLLENTLKNHYMLVKQIQGRNIYKRNFS